ncbi:MAG: hypothetical protein NW207_12120 [Cytophagales bacterium]|nr:hypothetical protein [Cytophagales bacterium]
MKILKIYHTIALGILTLMCTCKGPETIISGPITVELSMSNTNVNLYDNTEVTVKTSNTTDKSQSITFSFFLSSDANYSTDDAYLTSQSLNIPTGSNTQTVTVNISIGTSGKNYLLARYMPPSKTENMTASVEFTLTTTGNAQSKTDRVKLSNYSTPISDKTSCSSFYHYFYTSLTGVGSSLTFYYNLYLSKDTQYDAQDIKFYSSNTSSTIYNYLEAKNNYITIPNTAATGTYYLLVYGYYYDSDQGKNVYMTLPSNSFKVTNNASSSPYTITGVYLSGNEFTIGSDYSVNTGVLYGGGNSSNSSTYAYFYYYFSTDSLYSSNDIYVTNSYNTVNIGNSSVSDDITFIKSSSSSTSTSALTPGSYYLIVRIQYSDYSCGSTSSYSYVDYSSGKITLKEPDLSVTGISFTTTTATKNSTFLIVFLHILT